jgi:hypothetical protein
VKTGARRIVFSKPTAVHRALLPICDTLQPIPPGELPTVEVVREVDKVRIPGAKPAREELDDLFEGSHVDEEEDRVVDAPVEAKAPDFPPPNAPPQLLVRANAHLSCAAFLEILRPGNPPVVGIVCRSADPKLPTGCLVLPLPLARRRGVAGPGPRPLSQISIRVVKDKDALRCVLTEGAFGVPEQTGPGGTPREEKSTTVKQSLAAVGKAVKDDAGTVCVLGLSPKVTIQEMVDLCAGLRKAGCRRFDFLLTTAD